MGEEMRRKEGFCGKAAILNFRSDIAVRQNWHLTIISGRQPWPPLEAHFSNSSVLGDGAANSSASPKNITQTSGGRHGTLHL